MTQRIRRGLALATATLMFSMALSTAAAADMVAQSDAANASAAVDALVLRPAGFVSLVVGTALFVVTSPFVLLTRPHEIGRPFDELVVAPARFLWIDPLGEH